MHDPFLHNEKTVLLRVAQGDEQAFRLLFGAYHQPLAIHVYRLTESAELTEEIVQDVFMKIWMSREALVEVERFSAWLFTVSKNYTLNALRSIARERSRQQAWAADNEETDTKDERQGYYYSLIDKAIQQLPPQQQKVYLFSRHERLKHREIAERMGISTETVKKYMQLAIASISDYVREHADILLLLAAAGAMQTH